MMDNIFFERFSDQFATYQCVIVREQPPRNENNIEIIERNFLRSEAFFFTHSLIFYFSIYIKFDLLSFTFNKNKRD